MKAKLIIASWLISLSLFATNNIILGLVALCLFGASCWFVEKHKKEVMDEVNKMNRTLEKLINK